MLALSKNRWKEYISRRCFEHNLEFLSTIRQSPPETIIVSQNSTNLSESKSTLTTLKNSVPEKTRIVLIGQTPRFLDLDYFRSNSLVFPNQNYPERYVKLNKSDKVAIEIARYEGRFAKKQGWSYINSMRILCPKGECARKIESSWLYSDIQHLTIPGTLLFENELRKLQL